MHGYAVMQICAQLAASLPQLQFLGFKGQKQDRQRNRRDALHAHSSGWLSDRCWGR